MCQLRQDRGRQRLQWHGPLSLQRQAGLRSGRHLLYRRVRGGLHDDVSTLEIRFEDGSALLQSLRMNEGLASFHWLPSGEVPAEATPGAVLSLELVFTDSERRFHVRGRVIVRRAEGPKRGLRFELLREEAERQELVLLSARGESVPYRRRTRPRLPCHLPTELSFDGRTHPAQLVDLSSAGAHLTTEAMLALDAYVSLELRRAVEPLTVAARVMWTAPRERSVGVEFHFASADERALVAVAVRELTSAPT